MSIEKIRIRRTPEEAESSIIQLFALLYSGTLDRIEAKCGPEGLKAAKKAFIDSMVKANKAVFEKNADKSIASYLRWLLSNITVGHEYEIVENREDSVAFRFTSCPWARYFRAIGKEDIGFLFCAADGPLASAFNKKIKFRRTKTLMQGHDHCNHHYYYEEKEA